MQTRRDCRVRAKHPQLSGDVPLYRAAEQGIQGRDAGGAGRLPKCHFNMLEGLLHAINCHGKDGAIYVSDLAREIRQPLPAVSRGLRLMEQDGTVVREPDPADRRKTLVRITPKGYELCHQCEQALRNYFASVLARLEPEQVAQMDALRGALMDAILAENAARNIDPKGETNHDKDL